MTEQTTKTQALLDFLTEAKTMTECCAFLDVKKCDATLENLTGAGCVMHYDEPNPDYGLPYARAMIRVYVATGVRYEPRNQKGSYTSTNPETIKRRESVQKWFTENKEHRAQYMRSYYAEKLSKSARDLASKP